MAGIPPSPIGPKAFSSGNEFADMMTKQHLNLGSESKAAVAAALERLGYDVDVSDTANADAVLNVTFVTAMYFSDPPIAGGHCKPSILIKSKLTETKSGATLYQREYFYSTETGSTGMSGWARIPADPKYEFADCDSFFAHPAMAAQGLREAAPALAEAIGRELTR